MNYHISDPSPLIEATFQRIYEDRMVGLPMVNPLLSVAAVGFSLQEGKEWRGAVLTPWGINLMLLPASADWLMPNSHERTFRKYPSGAFAFLGNHEDGLGEYLICPLVHDMQHYDGQQTALNTARACLIALDLVPDLPATPASPAPPTPDPEQPASPSRRRFFTRQSV